MPTVRELILASSTLAAGNIHRDHLNNLGGGVIGTVIIGGKMTANIDYADLTINKLVALSANVGKPL